jgi:RHS repeat-associated protein
MTAMRQATLHTISLFVLAATAAPAFAQDPEPCKLTITARVDGSTPPVGSYPDRDHPGEYDPHATALECQLGALPLGNPLTGSATCEYGAVVPDALLKWEVVSLVPGKRTLQNETKTFYTITPYFVADEEFTCPAGGSHTINKTLYPRWGNVVGTVKLNDGTLVAGLGVTAAPENTTIPPGAVTFTTGYETFTNLEGRYSFATGFIYPDSNTFGCLNPPWPCEQIAAPNLPWGLQVLGDGGIRGNDKRLKSNTPGAFTWKIGSAGKSGSILVQSGQTQSKDFVMTLDELLRWHIKQRDKKRRPSENRPKNECLPGNATSVEPPTASAPYPVSLITGNVFLDEVDAVLPGLQDLVFSRSYNSDSGPAGTLGKGWNHAYDVTVEPLLDRVFSVNEGHGAPSYFTDPDGDGTLTPYGGGSVSATLTRTSSGFMRRFREGHSEEFDSQGRLVRQVDRLARATVLVYDDQNRLTGITSPEGRQFRLRYSGNDERHVSHLEGPDGIIADYRYRARGSELYLDRVRYADGTGYQYSYDEQGRLTVRRDLAGVTLDRHGYDDQGRAAWSELAAGQNHYDYTYEDGRTTVRDGRGSLSVFEWETKKAGRFIKKITGCGFCGSATGPRTWTRDEQGRVLVHVNADQKPTSYVYEGDNLVSVTNALNQATTFAGHDSFGRPATMTVPGYGTTTFTYVPEGVKSVELPGGQTTTYEYQGGRLSSVTTDEDVRFEFQHNARGELESIKDSRRKMWTFTYDRAGRRQTATAPAPAPNTDAVTVHFQYDARGRLQRVIRPDREVHQYAYDASGRLISVTDAAGRTAQYSYDPFDRQITTVGPLGDLTRVAYDTLSNVTALTDAAGRTTRFQYDSVARLERMFDPMNGEESYTYRPGGLLETKTDRKGVVTTYGYDDIGRLTSMMFSDGITPPLGITYDDLQRSMTLTNGTDTVTLVFDVSGRLASETSTRNGSTVSYKYNDDHQRTEMRLDNVLLANYGYIDGVLRTLSSRAKTFAFDYDDLGRRQRMEYPNGIVTTYGYHPTVGWLETLRAGTESNVVTQFNYTHDKTGNRLSKATPELTERYSYDAGSRLIGVTRESKSWSFSYDQVGNRRVEQVDGVPRTFTHDDRNRLVTVSGSGTALVEGTTTGAATVQVNGQPVAIHAGNVFSADAAVNEQGDFTVRATDASSNARTNTYHIDMALGATYEYDANGNLITKTEGSWNYEWNALNQLTRVLKDGAEVTRFAYDPLGRRVEKIVGGVATKYTYDGGDIIRETRESVDPAVRTYIHGPGIDEPLAHEEGGTWHYYHADGLGSIVATTDTARSVTSRITYDAWGNVESGAPVPHGFTGREHDLETGLMYYRARYYDPKIGRFLSEDPIGDGPNAYAYVGNGPIGRRDPSGLTWLDWVIDEGLNDILVGVGMFEAGLQGIWPHEHTADSPLTAALEAYKDAREEPYLAIIGCGMRGMRLRLKLRLQNGGVTGAELARLRAEFNSMKPQIWREEARANAGAYSAENLARMQQGKAPIGSDGHPMELHHTKPLAEGGTNALSNIEKLTRTDHRLGENYKKNHPGLP